MKLVKICGNRTLEDVTASMNQGADYIGFIFAAESKRQVKAEEVGSWMKFFSERKLPKLVGVFVRPTIQSLKEVLKIVPLDCIQLHGDENVQFVQKVKETFGRNVWKALHHHEQIIAEMEKYAPFVDGYVIDSRVKGMWGGTGIPFDWSDVGKYTNWAKDHQKLCFIAGGITPENVTDLLANGADFLDIASGVETDGKKDEEKIAKLIEKVKGYDRLSR